MTTTVKLKIDVALLSEIQVMAKQDHRNTGKEVEYLVALGMSRHEERLDIIRKMDRAAVNDTTGRGQENNILQFPCTTRGGN